MSDSLGLVNLLLGPLQQLQVEEDPGKYIGAAVSLIAGLVALIGHGYMGGKAIEVLSKNPGVETFIFKQYMVGSAICELVAICGFLTSIILVTWTQ